MLCPSSPPLPHPSPHPTLEDPMDFPEVFKKSSPIGHPSLLSIQEKKKNNLLPPKLRFLRYLKNTISITSDTFPTHQPTTKQQD